MASNVASHVPFKDLCNLCERISKKVKKDEKRKALSDFIKHWREFHNKLHKNDPSAVDSFYPAMRLLLPQLERERGAYGIKESTLAKLYIEILCLAKDSEDAQKLLNYRTPKHGKAIVGDFASVAEAVLHKRCNEGGTLKIYEVNEYLDNIATSNADKNRADVKKNLKKLLCNTSALEQKWLIRMILKEMKMGISEQTVLNTYHPDAKDLYNVTSSVAKVCMQLKDTSVRLHEIEISLFSPFRPMLAAQAAPSQVPKMMDNRSFLIETKFDGERVQMHKQDNIFKYFSRSSIEYTHAYGETPVSGSLTPFIAKAFGSQVKSCILDGEMVGWNKKLSCIGSKGENFDVKSLQPDDEDYQACFCVFDILFYNGRVLSNVPLKERLKFLDGLFTDVEGRMILTVQRDGTSKEDVISQLNLAIDNREEGIIVKSPSSIYKPNTRGWVKVKPEYVSNVMNEMDLLIIGGFFGEGRRRGIMSHFLLGVAVQPEDKDEHPKVFHSFAKVGSGYTLQELYQLLNKLKDNWQVYEKRRPPVSIVLASGHKEKPDLWIEPSKSQIVQVKAAEIINSDRFKTDCTLRFPRVEKVRYDKPWHQCMNVGELEELKKQAAGKLAFKHFVDDDGNDSDEPSPKKRAIVSRKQEFKLGSQFAPANVEGIVKESSMFACKEICIVSGPASHPKHELERMVVKFGGSVVQNPGSQTFCVLSDKLNIKTKNFIKTGEYDVVKTSWLLKCIESKRFIPWSPFDMWHSRETTVTELAEDYDEYGDSFTKDLTLEDLRIVFDNIPAELIVHEKIRPSQIADLEFKYFACPGYDIGLFRICRAYFDNKAILENESAKIDSHPLEIAELKFRYYGGTVTSNLDQHTTHVITHSTDRTRLSLLKERNVVEEGKRLYCLVSEDWVNECVKEAKLVTERNYYP